MKRRGLFPDTLEAQRAYIQRGGCGDMYPQPFRDFAAAGLVNIARDDMQLATALAFLFTQWQCAQLAAASETLERMGATP